MLRTRPSTLLLLFVAAAVLGLTGCQNGGPTNPTTPGDAASAETQVETQDLADRLDEHGPEIFEVLNESIQNQDLNRRVVGSTFIPACEPPGSGCECDLGPEACKIAIENVGDYLTENVEGWAESGYQIGGVITVDPSNYEDPITYESFEFATQVRSEGSDAIDATSPILMDQDPPLPRSAEPLPAKADDLDGKGAEFYREANAAFQEVYPERTLVEVSAFYDRFPPYPQCGAIDPPPPECRDYFGRLDDIFDDFGHPDLHPSRIEFVDTETLERQLDYDEDFAFAPVPNVTRSVLLYPPEGLPQ